MDVKCPGCFQITTVFSHASTVVQCGSCATVLCQPSGGKAKLTEGKFASFSCVHKLTFLRLLFPQEELDNIYDAAVCGSGSSMTHVLH